MGEVAASLKFNDVTIVQLAAISQYLFCPRRFALMYVEGVFQANSYTEEGTNAHEHADCAGYEVRRDAHLLRALPLYSKKYGLVGKADIVERGNNYAVPIEYKLGKKREWDNDEAQLCAQALCLEEMFNCEVSEGFIYHVKSKQRRNVIIDQQLREMTIRAIDSIRKIIINKITPAGVLEKKCTGCSLHEICMPEVTSNQSESNLEKLVSKLWSSR